MFRRRGSLWEWARLIVFYTIHIKFDYYNGAGPMVEYFISSLLLYLSALVKTCQGSYALFSQTPISHGNRDIDQLECTRGFAPISTALFLHMLTTSLFEQIPRFSRSEERHLHCGKILSPEFLFSTSKGDSANMGSNNLGPGRSSKGSFDNPENAVPG